MWALLPSKVYRPAFSRTRHHVVRLLPTGSLKPFCKVLLALNDRCYLLSWDPENLTRLTLSQLALHVPFEICALNLVKVLTSTLLQLAKHLVGKCLTKTWQPLDISSSSLLLTF